MAGSDSWTDQIRDWFERTPAAQRAVKRLREDLDVVAAHVEKATRGLMAKVGPIIDPPARSPAPPAPPASNPAPDKVAGDTSWTGFSPDPAERQPGQPPS